MRVVFHAPLIGSTGPGTEAETGGPAPAVTDGPIYADGYPRQDDGDAGCLCRTCGREPARYLDQCQPCRRLSTVADDRAFLRPGGERDRRQAHG